MIGTERFLDIDGERFYASTIKKLDKNQIKQLSAFAENEEELIFIQSNCDENYSYLIDNIIFKL